MRCSCSISDHVPHWSVSSCIGVDGDAALGAAVPLGSAASPRDVLLSSTSSPKTFPFVTDTAHPTAPLVAITDANDFDTRCVTEWGGSLSKPSLFMESPVCPDTTLVPGYTIFDVFRALHDDRAPVLVAYREWRRDTEMTFEPWRAPTAGAGPADPPMSGQRKFNCMTIIKVMISEKAYPLEEYHRYGMFNLNGVPTLFYQTSGQPTGVAFSDTFRAETLSVYSQGVDPSSGLPLVTVRMYMYVQFIKFSISHFFPYL